VKDVSNPVVGIKKFLHMPPGTLEYVRTGASTHINKTEHVIQVQQSLITVVPGSIQSRRTAINVSAVLSGTGTRNVFSGIALNTFEHPLPFYFMSPIALAPTEIAFFDFDGLVRNADFLRVAQHTVQHEPSTDFVPFLNG
jgi:hypothetical protein